MICGLAFAVELSSAVLSCRRQSPSVTSIAFKDLLTNAKELTTYTSAYWCQCQSIRFTQRNLRHDRYYPPPHFHSPCHPRCRLGSDYGWRITRAVGLVMELAWFVAWMVWLGCGGWAFSAYMRESVKDTPVGALMLFCILLAPFALGDVLYMRKHLND